jgi:N-acetylglucosaminyldiphosphoundecaprenol N-acetyl-beta-D-mannosaminyltransferase
MKDGTHLLLGTHLEAVMIDQILERVEQSVVAQKRCLFATLNLHGIYLYHRSPAMREFYSKATLVWPDGMSLISLAWLSGIPLRRKNRIAFVDLLPDLCELASAKGWRIFYLGAAPGVAQRGLEILRQRYPDLQMECAHGYFDVTRGSQDNQAILAILKAYRPHILMVGMGQPRQEQWISENWDSLPVNAVFHPGACMDYIAGVVPTPPRWMGKIGLEWLFRLASEPKRLWRRYLIEPWFLLPVLLRQLLSARKPRPDEGGWRADGPGPNSLDFDK